MDRATRHLRYRAPKYIMHQNREFYCIRRNPGILARQRKWRAEERLEDRKFRREHIPLDMMLSFMHEEWFRPKYKAFAAKRVQDLR